MKISEADILILPGLGGSSPGHWQLRWAERMSNAAIVEQADWDEPDLDDWVSTIEQAILLATRPVVLVAHSLSCIAVAHTASRLIDSNVRGAFLVAPPDIELSPDAPEETYSFRPIPRDPLPFPSLLVASSNDPLCTIDRAVEFATCWGSDFHQAGEAGHINVASGHGPWPEGLLMFTRLMQRI
ncbi:putative esterase of the alpha/beta hydrolase fold protein [Devosia sp. LC5]|uniref:RBBP9/YdeN family alpha/beta hydrolase n=1 Tax=Devosia sp. LC5 TaxID=1502724 RepID=UPI0004E3D49C|nr:alpha/beta hydrolase [Devosia sp. LC5]KFC69201.1 putative esterase of the alpha/beta hydrolase fold protein [Devosia sp. LC5]